MFHLFSKSVTARQTYTIVKTIAGQSEFFSALPAYRDESLNHLGRMSVSKRQGHLIAWTCRSAILFTHGSLSTIWENPEITSTENNRGVKLSAQTSTDRLAQPIFLMTRKGAAFDLCSRIDVARDEREL